MYEQRFALRAISIDDQGFTDVVDAYLPIACNIVIIYNSTNVDIYLRSDPANAASQVTIIPGQQFEIGSHAGPFSTYSPFRFPLKCGAVAALKSSSGAVTPLIECLQ